MATFRFLHVSDLHISVTPRKVGVGDVLLGALKGLTQISRVSSQDPDLLEAVAALAYNRRNVIDAIIITGDLATTGNRDDLDEAFNFVDGSVGGRVPWLDSRNKPTLQGARRPIVLIPGNHDRFKGLWCKPGGDEFDKVFKKYWSVGQSAQILCLLPANSPELVIIGADFTLRHKTHAQGRGGMWGQGKVYPKGPLKKLAHLTNTIRSANPDVGIIWSVHFPPDFPEGERALKLIDEEELIKAATSCGVTVLLTGHTHNPKRFVTPPLKYNNLEVLCAGTATQLTAPVGHVAHLVEIEVGTKGVLKVQRQDLWWNDNHLSFI